MKLSDVMSAMNLATYAEAGLVLFLAAFVAVAFDLARRGKELDAHANLPLSADGERSSERKGDS
jgi:hypothetical protein